MVGCVVCFIVYYIVPYVDGAPLIKFFPYSEQKLTWSMYLHFWAVYVSRALFICTIDAFSDFKYTKSFKWLALLELIAMVNFACRYGEDFFGIEGFDMMTIRMVSWATVAVIQITKNHSNRKHANQ